jgi:sporulation protein YlmC with PRC-barrel domain
MGETTEFTIGSEVACTDGVCGDLRRVVIDPVARAITHLVVEPRHRHDAGHLVPIDLVTSTAKEIQLRCTMSQFDALEAAEETQFLAGDSGQAGYMQGGRATGVGGWAVGGKRRNTDPHAASYDHVPEGEVELRRGDHVDATDGAIGQVQGLLVDPSDHHVTHILLDEGHLWGKKTVAIPISAVTRLGAIIRLNLTKNEVQDLPPVDVRQASDPAGPGAAAG